MPFILRRVNPADEPTVLKIFKRSPRYFLRVEGREPDEDILRSEVDGRPKRVSEEYRKDFLLVLQADEPIGIVDIHLNHPEAGIGYIGLFLLVEDLHGKGIGKGVYSVLEAYCARKKIRHIRLGVSDDNDVSIFWRKIGFAPNGNTYDFQGVNRATHAVEYEKAIF